MLVETTIEKPYLSVSFLAHSIYVLVPAEVVHDPDAQTFICINNFKGFVTDLDSWDRNTVSLPSYQHLFTLLCIETKKVSSNPVEQGIDIFLEQLNIQSTTDWLKK